jgi:hypothetical protein
MTTAQSHESTAAPRRLHRAPSAVRSGASRHPTLVSRRTLIGYLAVPRPKDLFKALLMPVAFGMAVVVAGGTSAHTVLRAVVVLAALELLVYPARYQWNDVRGFAADQRHPAEADRGRLPGPLERARPHIVTSCVVALARLVVTAALPLLLPGLHLGAVLGWVVVGVFGVAVAYEALRAVGTGRTGEVPPPLRPVLVLLWVTVGAGYLVRGLTGLALVVDLRREPAVGVSAAVALWACGVAFVTSRWAIEATAFARLHLDRVSWTADAAHAREHLLALVRWLPKRPNHRDVALDGSAAGWAALRGRTPLSAPWNLAMIVAGTAAALTGRLLTGHATPGEAALTATVGGLTAWATVRAPRGRSAATAVAAVVLLSVLALQDGPRPLLALLPWLAVMTAYLRFIGRSLRTMGGLGSRLRAALGMLLAPAARVTVGRDTWDVLTIRESARG